TSACEAKSLAGSPRLLSPGNGLAVECQKRVALVFVPTAAAWRPGQPRAARIFSSGRNCGRDDMTSNSKATISVIVEWENVLLAEQVRARAMLIELHAQAM